MSQLEPVVSDYLNQLDSLLLHTFDEGGLTLLAAELGVNVEDLTAANRRELSRALATYFHQTGRLPDLLAAVRRQRPLTNWPDIPEAVLLAGLPPAGRLQEARKLTAVPEPAASLPLGSRLLLRRNPLFTGRLPDLQALAQAIFGGETAVITQSAAITGLGGVGKSQLAVEFAYRYGRYFAGGVFWLSFADAANITTEIVACGGPGGLDLPGFAALSFPAQVERVQAEWRSATPRLLIFDNCEETALLDEYAPASGGCCVLVTSRNQYWGDVPEVRLHRLGTLLRSESVALLRRFLPELADSEANAIADELGDLPLALHLAGSYLKTYRAAVTPAAFPAELRNASLTHPAMKGKGSNLSPTRHELSLEYTFELSYGRLKANELPEDDLARTLLHRAACLAPGELLPRDLLLALASEEVNPLDFEDSLRRLVALGLLEPAEDGFRLHRLLARFVGAADSEYDTTYQNTEDAIATATGKLNQLGYPLQLLAWVPHLRYLAAEAVSREDDRRAYLNNELGGLLHAQGNDVEARQYYEWALTIREQILGPDHPDTAISLNNLGYLLEKQGEYIGARRYFERALAIWERVLGPDHPNIAISYNNLGGLLDSQADYAEARWYYERALAIREKVLGPDHPDTAESLNNLGYLLSSQGDYAGARLYYERALAIREKVLGPHHPDTATSLNNLGHLLESQADYTRALPYYEQALAIREQMLGLDHPDTAGSLNNLGYLLSSQGDYVGAQAYYERALAIKERVLGIDHPDTALSVNNLGTLLQSVGNYEGAWPYLERALAIRERVLGPDHPDTASSLNNLGALLDSQGDYEGARPYYERALAIRERVLGPDHPETAISLNNLGYLLKNQGNYALARPYYERALSILERILGSKHPYAQSVRRNLAALPPV